MSRLSPATAFILLALSTTIAVPSCFASTVEEVQSRGRLTVISFPHQDSRFISVNLETGAMQEVGTAEHFSGVDVDMMSAFAAKLGVALEIRPIKVPSYGELIPALIRGEGDIVASSLSITEARQELADFSEPYYGTKVVVVVPRDVQAESFKDLAGSTAATIPGTSHEEILHANGFDAGQIDHVAFTRDNLLAVDEGSVGFTVMDAQSVARLASEFPNLKIAFHLPGGDEYGYAVSKGSDLLEPLNELIRTMKKSGELGRIIESHGVDK